jgi:glutamate dehydrogenase
VKVQEESPAGSAEAVSDVVVALARERDGETLARFVAAYLRRPAGADGERAGDPEALLAEARGALALADARDGAAAGVRAFTPHRDEHG